MSAKENERIYNINDVVAFRKTTEQFGGLSNMASGYRVLVNGISIPTAEALYQACRFPHAPQIQRQIVSQSSPMAAKLIGRDHLLDTRSDWDSVKVRIMRWCLRVKLAQNIDSFGELLRQTGTAPIVEVSSRDRFWGANLEGQTLSGANVLGRLLMELRDSFVTEHSSARIVAPPNVNLFLLFGSDVATIKADDKSTDLAHANNQQIKLAL